MTGEQQSDILTEFDEQMAELEELGIFGELSLGAEIDMSRGGARLPTFGAAVGFNWHF
jgi:hypothetical protein